MKDLIEKIRREWSIPKKTVHRGEISFFQFVCILNHGLIISDDNIPYDIKAFLLESNGAELFKDADYGQWGLKIFSYDEIRPFNQKVRSWRNDILETDLIIGEFIGDSDLIIVSLKKETFGEVIICTPIDDRKDWYFLKINFAAFLEKYTLLEGDKFWEVNNVDE